MRKITSLILLAAMMLGIATHARGDDAPDVPTPTMVAKRFLVHFRAGKHDESYKLWDFHAMLSVAFQKDIESYDTKSRDEMAALFQNVIDNLTNLPLVDEELKQARYTDFVEKQFNETMAEVRFVQTSPRLGAVKRTLLFRKQNDGWRIVDGRAGDRPMAAVAIRGGYLKARMRPLEFCRTLASKIALWT